MQFQMTVEMDNAAFEDGGHEELARILRKVADQVEYGNDSRACMDSNGNKVGSFEITGKKLV